MKRMIACGWIVAVLLIGLLSLTRSSTARANFVEVPATAPNLASSALTLTLKWRACWPGSWCETGWYASPAVADVNADGQAEVIWGGYTLTAINGSSGTIKWTWASPGGERLWPGIVVADLDNNGSLEIVTGNGDGYVSVLKGDGTSYSSAWPEQNFSGDEIRSLAVADMDGDHRMEIAIARASGGSYNQWTVLEPDGTTRSGWPNLKSGQPGYGWGAYNENIGVADIDRDGRAELIGPSDVHYISAFNDDGSQIRANAMFPPAGAYWSQVGVNVDQTADLRGWTECATERRPNFANSAPTIADVNGDGILEIIVVGNVYNCNTDPYTDLYEMPFILKADRSRWSGSGFDWTVIPPDPGASARPLSEDWTVMENSVPNPVAADLDGDGRKEILYPSYDGRVHAYWLDKTEHGSWPFEVYGGSGYYRFATEPIVADLNNDGKAEVIFASWTQHGSNQPGKLYIVSWDGNLIQSIDLPRDSGSDWGGSLAAPTIADIDGDGAPEIVVGTVDMGVVAYDVADASNTRILWGTGRGNYQRTGAILNGSLNNSIKTVSDSRPDPGETLTYTLKLIDPGPTLSSARVTDTLPSNAFLVGGSVWASSGSWGVGGSVLTWTGAVTQSIGVTVTYAMTLSGDITQPTAIVNTALIDDGLGNVQSRTAAAVVNGYAVFLPLIRK